jgi:hypothetical protein
VFRYGDIAGVAGVELLSIVDSSDCPKDGVLAMANLNDLFIKEQLRIRPGPGDASNQRSSLLELLDNSRDKRK